MAVCGSGISRMLSESFIKKELIWKKQSGSDSANASKLDIFLHHRQDMKYIIERMNGVL